MWSLINLMWIVVGRYIGTKTSTFLSYFAHHIPPHISTDQLSIIIIFSRSTQLTAVYIRWRPFYIRPSPFDAAWLTQTDGRWLNRPHRRPSIGRPCPSDWRCAALHVFTLQSKLQLKPFRVDDISPLFKDKSHDKDRSLVCFLCGSATISLEGRKKLRNRDLTGRMVGASRSLWQKTFGRTCCYRTIPRLRLAMECTACRGSMSPSKHFRKGEPAPQNLTTWPH